VGAVRAGPWRRTLPQPGTSTPAPVPPRPTASTSPGPLSFDHRVLLTVEGMELVAYQTRHNTQTVAVAYCPARSRYEEILFAESAVPSPAGDVAVVTGPDLPPIGVLDLDTRKYHQWNVNAYLVSDPQWSVDGHEVLVSVNDKQGDKNGFAIVDAATGRVSTYWIDRKYDSYRYHFSWHPDGRHVVLALADRTNASEAEPDKVSALQLFTADGRPDGTLPVRGFVDGLESWSPDGRYVVAQGVAEVGGRRVNQYQIVEVASGHVVAGLFLEGQAWWIDGGRILLTRYDRGPGGLILEVVDSTGRPLRSYPLPSELDTGGLMFRRKR
jgi:hypothetical protein